MTGRYLAWRLLQVPPVVLAILVVSFVLIRLAPGDPILALAGENGDAAYYAEMRAKFGLDRPLLEQLGLFIVNVLRLDFGVSYVHGRPAVDVILERVPATLLLVSSALLLASVAGIGLGLVAAANAHGNPDLAVSLGTLSLHSIPVFWLAMLAILTFSLTAGWFPVSGMTNPRSAASGPALAIDVAHHLILPMAVLAATELAVIARLTRVGVMDELLRDYVRTARAKGLSERRVLTRHAFRLAMLPVVTVIGARVGHIMAGAVLVETVFGWPGVGRLLLSSVQARDTPIVLGIILLISGAVIVANVVTDLTYARLDPRIHFA
jgi:peptide/nickel transport system permease protein